MILARLFSWIYDLYDARNTPQEADMNHLRSRISSIQTSYIISHFLDSNKPKLYLGHLYALWPSLSLSENCEAIPGPPVYKNGNYKIFILNEKLKLKTEDLLGQNFKFTRAESHVRNSRPLLIILRKIRDNDNLRVLSVKLEEYLDVFAVKDDACMVVGLKDEEKLPSFCADVGRLRCCDAFSLTSFDLEASGRQMDVSGEKASVGDGNLVRRDGRSDVAETDSKSPSNDDDVCRRAAKFVRSGKPPDVLVYTGSNETNNKKFERVQALLHRCLSRDRYVVYHLTRDQVTSDPWLENAALLVLAADKIPKNGISELFMSYFVAGGTIISLSSNFDENFLDLTKSRDQRGIIKVAYKDKSGVSVFGDMSSYEKRTSSDVASFSTRHLAFNSDTGSPIIVLAQHHSSGKALLSLVSFENDAPEEQLSQDLFIALKQSNASRIEIFRDLLSNVGFDCDRSESPALSPLYLFGVEQESIDACLSALKIHMKGNFYSRKEISYEFLATDAPVDASKETNRSYQPVVVVDGEDVRCEFDFDIYKKYLKTSVLGNVVMFGDVVSTTMMIMDDYMDHMPANLGLVVVANCQTSGIGRGGNAWLSPKGCGMFSLHVRILLDSPFGRHLSCLQHLVALAIVLSVKTKSGFENIDVGIKWPNDVYYAGKLKLGGIIVKSTVTGDAANINIGCGINVANKDPTGCINDLIVQHNCSKPDESQHLPLFTVEEFVARIISHIEELLLQFQMDSGDSFFKLYYKYWLHSNQEVTLHNEGQKGKVLGITQYGYLLVRLEDGRITEVHPDGNSFDMMRNLILPKH